MEHYKITITPHKGGKLSRASKSWCCQEIAKVVPKVVTEIVRSQR